MTDNRSSAESAVLWRKKPVVIEAWQWNYEREGELRGVCNCHEGDWGSHLHTMHAGQIVALEVGDWIIPEPDGEHYYPCKPDVFANTYERADIPAPAQQPQVPKAWFCFVPSPPGEEEPLRIRAWTTDAERAKRIGEVIGQEFEPLYASQPSPAATVDAVTDEDLAISGLNKDWNAAMRRALDAEADALRLHGEKMEMYERAIAAEAKLAAHNGSSAGNGAAVLRHTLTDIAAKRYDENADIDDICTMAESAIKLYGPLNEPQTVAVPGHGPRTALHPYGQPLKHTTPGVTWEDHLAAEANDAKAD